MSTVSPSGLPLLDEVFVVNGRTIAVAKRQWHRLHDPKGLGRPGLVRSTAFVCPTCGELWGRRYIPKPPIPEAEVAGFSWVAEMRYCEAHGDGSLLISDYELSHMVDPYYSCESFYPLAWMAYELFLQIRRTN
jgi:hypothetical protein